MHKRRVPTAARSAPSKELGSARAQSKGETTRGRREDAAATEYQALIEELLQIRRDMVAFARDSKDLLDRVHADYRDSAENLLHYIALRSSDLRALQMRLASAGLSSIGRAESHVLS